MNTIVSPRTLTTRTCDEALAETLRYVVEQGHSVSTHPTSEPDKGKGSTEVLGFQVQITNPRNRVLVNPERLLNPVGAVARFVWMVAGSDRLEDIAFYEPKVRAYTDNAISVPGSNYGMRLFQPKPGLSQIEGVIERLRAEKGSRRAAAVIWTPEDAVRESQDIPCAFGAFYHVRNEKLTATTVMRSNNAFLLLPYNTFEFGVIAELIAASLNVELGSLVHYAASMHVYDRDIDKARKVVDAFDQVGNAIDVDSPNIAMKPIPNNRDPLQQALELAKLEATLRNDAKTITEAASHQLAEMGTQTLNEYWIDYYRVLMCHALVRVERFTEARELARLLPEYFAARILIQVDDAEAKAAPQFSQGFLFPTEPTAARVREALTPTANEYERAINSLHRQLDELERQDRTIITRTEADELRKVLLSTHSLALAARSEQGSSASDDRLSPSVEETRKALRLIRSS